MLLYIYYNLPYNLKHLYNSQDKRKEINTSTEPKTHILHYSKLLLTGRTKGMQEILWCSAYRSH